MTQYLDTNQTSVLQSRLTASKQLFAFCIIYVAGAIDIIAKLGSHCQVWVNTDDLITLEDVEKN